MVDRIFAISAEDGSTLTLDILPIGGCDFTPRDTIGAFTPPEDIAPIRSADGTRIATPVGLRPVTTLAPGDLVLTLNRDAKPAAGAPCRAAAQRGRTGPASPGSRPS